MDHPTLDEHIFSPGPKHMLSIDGGGVRAGIALGYLRRIENILRHRFGDDPDFRLSDYFDLVGGTSTGAIVAAGVALGMSVDELQSHYGQICAAVFKKKLLRIPVIQSKYSAEPLARTLRKHIGEMTLGSDELKTGIMIVAKRLDTGSPWVLHNNPRGKFFSSDAGNINLSPNSDFRLWEVVHASAAAPFYFDAKTLHVSEGFDGVFVDGAVSPHNNPALQLLMLATLDGYGFKWDLGNDSLLLVSIGTGFREMNLSSGQVNNMSSPERSLRALISVISDCDWLSQSLLQWMSRSPTPWDIDSEIGDLRHDLLSGRELLTYLRYSIRLESTWIGETLGIDIKPDRVADLSTMDNADNVEELVLLGQKAAEVQVKEEHFPPSFDPPLGMMNQA